LPPILKNLLAYLPDVLFPKRRAMAELRARWGKPGDKDGWLASDYFDLVRDCKPDACIDDKTWLDLEYPEIFARMDSTATPVGSQVLYRQLRTHVDDEDELARRHALYARLQSDARLRDALQARLIPLKDEHNARIAHFLFGELPPPLRHRGLLWGWSLLSVLVLVVVLVASWPIWIWLSMVLVNAIVIVRNGDRAMRDVQTLTACLHLVKVANDLAAMRGDGASLPQWIALRAEASNRAELRKSLRPLAWLKLPAISVAATWLNFAFLVELLAQVQAMRRFAILRHKLAASFELVGGIDATIAIASWLEYCPQHCPPHLADRAVLELAQGYHPLLPEGVRNSIRLDRRSVLVTGSNMAGKTTFIKMVAVNALLAQTLGFCLASAATIPRSRVMASIQARHSVASGKSHYFSEVETIRSFLARQAQGGCTIFAIDELFSGTNTVERVAIARAVLESLGSRALVLATTHDIELQTLVAGHYDLCHFQESPEVDGFFDYRIRRGAATERNAIRLLHEIGFPETIIAKAAAYAEQPFVGIAEGSGSAEDGVSQSAAHAPRT
jgi:hypothetical protein